VITEERVMTLLEHANPVGSFNDFEPVDVDAASYLATLEQRSSEMTQIETLPETKPPERSRGSLIAAAVAAVLLIATIGIPLTNNDEQPGAASVVPTTLTGIEGMTSGEALSVAGSYFTVFNAGDADAVLALLTSDVVVADSMVGEWGPGEWERLLTWDTAQGTTYGPVECQVTDRTPDDFTVRCVTDTLQAVDRAVNSSPVAATITMVVNSDGLSDVSFLHGPGETAAVPFEAWMAVQFPDDPDAASFGAWTSIEEAEQNGLLRVQRAEEWVLFAAGAVEQTFADFNTGDLDGFLARFGQGAVVLNVGPQDARDVFAAQMTADTQYTLDRCAPNGVSAIFLKIECEFTTTDGSSGTLSMRVAASGLIGPSTISYD